ncbi:MAG: UDP-N-acetylmuramoyl-L-alanine--D-glutamate ligase [Planctomycetes bacterium]|nr:UDP-N-acetylmuramoyl-L-alanine--D-glutamate ligase [Planctomycetota bacterium]
MTVPPAVPTLPCRALVIGLGRFGGAREAVRYLLRHGSSVRIADRLDEAALAESVASLRSDPAAAAIDWQLGRQDEGLLDGVDLVVVNPAVPATHPLVDAAARRGLPRTQELSLFLDAYPGRVVFVTGTNGKSTTATLLHGALRRGGVDALLGGNVGHSLLADEAAWRRGQVAVVEISSFQLERIDPDRHRVEGAVLTPITRDHLDRHGTLEVYHAAKARAATAARAFLVHGADDPVARGFRTRAAHRLLHRDGPRDAELAAWVDADGFCRFAGDDRGAFHRGALALLGRFHVGNALAALLAARALGADPAGAALGVVLQRPLPYRLQLAGRLGGCDVYDNAVSTAVESTVSALESIDAPVHWIGGGKSKDGPEALPPAARELAPRLRGAHLFGAVAEALASELRRAGLATVTSHERLEDALDAARASAAAGSALLFSPAFASFDQFANFEARARSFRAWLRAQR